MQAALYQYGAPPNMGALSSLLEKKAEESSLRHYMATVEWSIGKALYKDNYIPTFSEMKKPKDTRTGAEIIEDIKNKLRSRREAANDGT